MEEKLLELFMVANKFSNESKKYFIKFEIDFEGVKKLEISVRRKITYDFVETQTIYLDEININRINKLIEFIKSYEVE